MAQFYYEDLYNANEFEILFHPPRLMNWKDPDSRTPPRRFAICQHENDAKLIVAALNKWCDDGGSWVI
jgi:hypothetical protein